MREPQDLEAIVAQYGDQGYYPAVALDHDIMPGHPHLVCANGHRWGSINPAEGCPVCIRSAKYRLMGRTECEVEGCDLLVECSDKMWDEGVRRCRGHWEQQGEWRAGPVSVGGMLVAGQYNPRVRWNGWLCPHIDALGVVTILDDVNEHSEAPYRTFYEWRDDGTLILTDEQWRDEDPENYQPQEVRPDEDGLYDLNTYSWCWEEGGTCPRHGGEWGEDEACEHCTYDDGRPRPLHDKGPMGPGEEA